MTGPDAAPSPFVVEVGRAVVRFTDRTGGVSRGPYASNNLAEHVGDDAAAVRENRTRLAAGLGERMPEPVGWVWLHQVHGAQVAVVDAAPACPPEADAAVTTAVGLPLTVLVADCAPIALVGMRALGVVHAGWAGLEAGVVERAVAAVRAVEDPAEPAEIRAVLGPCIHPGRYEFGVRDLDRLVARFGPTVAARTEWGSPAFDLPAAVKVALARSGVSEVLDVGICTSASPHHFSHRRDGTTGRQAMVVTRSA